MPSIDLHMTVRMEDGTEHDVHADQRDIAKWEVQPFAAEGRMNVQMRYLAWSALSRAGDYRQPWERFNNVDCVEAVDGGGAEDDGEDEQGPRPPERGQKTPPGES
jgi:hypothetical protein